MPYFIKQIISAGAIILSFWLNFLPWNHNTVTTDRTETNATTTQESLTSNKVNRTEITASSTLKLTKNVQNKKSTETKLKPGQNSTTTIETKKIIDFESVNQAVRSSVVNILCITGTNDISSITGSGVVIDPRGVILTNAHIGQFFLLKDYPIKDNINCTIRMGSPAYPTYKAELIYISSQWIKENKSALKDGEPKGTGEHDFAFLKVVSKTDGSTVESPLPFTPINVSNNFNVGDKVVLVSYPAEFLGGIFILKDLYESSSISDIQKLYTFTENKIDLISVGGTILSQRGASGGGVFDQNRSLVGIISTTSNVESTTTRPTSTDVRGLYAITVSHIDRSLREETNGGLLEFLQNDPSAIEVLFNSSLRDSLAKILTDSMKTNN